MYKMVVEITKETQEKCGIKTVKHYNEENHLIELWQKMSDIEIQLEHSSIACFKQKQRTLQQKKKKKKTLQKKKTKKKAFFEGEEGVFIIEKLARDIIERCKLLKAIEFRQKIRI